jgi:hypothetical protein
VPERETDRRRIKARIQRIEHSPEHRDCKVRLDHFRNIGCNDRDRVEAPHAASSQGGREAIAPFKQLSIRVASIPIDHGGLVAEGLRGSLQKADRCQGDIVCLYPIKSGLERMLGGLRHRSLDALS